MVTEIGSQIKVIHPSVEILQWCKDNLILPNPEYQKKSRMGFWTGNTPRELVLYEVIGDSVLIPYGCLKTLLPLLSEDYCKTTFKPIQKVDYRAKEIPLYDYQKSAVEVLLDNHYGILQSPAGSGKTQIGIALAATYGVKTLWLTHTKDLLTQSKTRAEQYFPKEIIGTITEGKVCIGAGITFATIQTMCKLDLDKYRDEWDCIIVDECHRVSGTPTAVTQFSKVLNALRARHKFGLSATVHRSDGLIKTTYAMLGNVVYVVPDEAVKEQVMKVSVLPVSTNARLDFSFLNSDGTINYCKMISYLVNNEERNKYIATDLIANCDHYNLILSERLEHLETLKAALPSILRDQAVLISGKMTSKKQKAEREQALEDMRQGKKHYLFATYSLAKEGLDIPRLDRLFLVTPQKDYAVIVQSVGRIARTFEGKKNPAVYDYVDYHIKTLQKSFKKRCTSYRKCNCEILG